MIPSKRPVSETATAPKRILYADDMPELRDVMRIAVNRDAHTIECFPDGQQALERVKADLNGFDVIITDHHMPRMNGLEFVTQLRACSFPGKILVFSSELSLEVHHAYEALSVDKILQKPVLPSELRKVLRDL